MQQVIKVINISKKFIPVIIIIAQLFFIVFFVNMNKNQKYEITDINLFGAISLKPIAEEESVDDQVSVFVDQLFDNNEQNRLLQAYFTKALKEKGYYHYQDVSLSKKFSNEFANPTGSQRDNLTSICDYFENKLEQNELIKELREKATSKLPPFQVFGEIVKIGTPFFDRPSKNAAYVPFEKFSKNTDGTNKKIKIVNPNNESRYLVLEAIPAFEENSGTVGAQINRSQAEYLFGAEAASYGAVKGIIIEVDNRTALYDPTFISPKEESIETTANDTVPENIQVDDASTDEAAVEDDSETIS